eukprot:GHUV01019039.1.p3 GENE.GHUV01019039.1~~GHUV01019039.1.p3  ORF type:complete len:115 (+),score=25.50 GHUV01019039.1:789-1133(+)
MMAGATAMPPNVSIKRRQSFISRVNFSCVVHVPRGQVLNKQVVTRTTGRSLGCISGAWLDPARGTLVSFDLDDRKPGSGPGLGLNSPARAGNIPLSALRQVGHWGVRPGGHMGD